MQACRRLGISGVHGHCVGHGIITYADTNAYTYPGPYTDADTDAHTDTHTYAYAYADPYTNANANTVADGCTDKTRRRRRRRLQPRFIVNGVPGIFGRDIRIIRHEQQTGTIIVDK